MKTTPRQLFLRAALAFCFTLTAAAFALETPPAPAAAPAPAPAPASEPDKSTPVAVPATPTPVAPVAPVAAAAPAEAPAPAVAPPDEPKLRRLDVPTPPDEPTIPRKLKRIRGHHGNGNEVVNIGRDAFLAKDHKADVVVAVFGSATSEGEVADSVVSVLGNTRVTGPAGNSVVTVFGNAYVNSKVGDSVVVVFGSLELGPEAEVAGDVVTVGGSVKRDPKTVIHGQINNVAFGGMFSDMEWLHSWFVNCAMYGRLLAFAPHLMWAWWIALGFLGFYVVLALLFGQGIAKCAETLEQRPGYSILSALLTLLLAPVVTIILVLTGVGIAVVPFLVAGLFFAGLFGKAVMLAWLGRRITRLFGVDHPALAVLVGGVILLGLYTVPILGLVLYKLFGWIGLGVVVYTLLLGMKREKPPVPPLVPPAPGAPVGDPAAGAAGLVLAPLAPPIGAAATLPRAGFWIRIAAVLLDVVLVGIVLALVRGSGKMEFLILAAYGAVMWKLRGSTIGGIVFGLKVVRLDDRELDWSTAIVRALGCFLSFVVLGLGFIWVAFDDQKQSWHDKIAGTTVVRVPKGVSLV